MSQWIEVAKVDDCPVGSVQELVVNDRIIALLNVGGELFAIDGICSHQGGPLGKATLEEGVVTCPWHGWQYDARTGCQLNSDRLAQSRFRVRVDAGKIWVSSSAIELSDSRE